MLLLRSCDRVEGTNKHGDPAILCPERQGNAKEARTISHASQARARFAFSGNSVFVQASAVNQQVTLIGQETSGSNSLNYTCFVIRNSSQGPRLRTGVVFVLRYSARIGIQERTMRIKAVLTAVVSVSIALGMISAAGATPKDSQRLRGMAGRVFYVEVEVVSTLIPGATGPVGTVFPNCYFFNEGGVWIDPPFGVPGNWVQHSNGAATPYTAFAIDGGLAVLQEGSVTPAKGRGVLQLEAFSQLLLGELVLAEFLSVGSEVDECPLPL